MDLYYGFILARDFVSILGEKLPDEVKRNIDKNGKKFGNFDCILLDDLNDDHYGIAEKCLRLDNLFPPGSLSIELGFGSTYFYNRIKKTKHIELSAQQAVILTDEFVHLVEKGLIPYRVDAGIQYSYVIDFYGVNIGFYHPSLVDCEDDLRFVYLDDDQSWTVEFPQNNLIAKFGTSKDDALRWRDQILRRLARTKGSLEFDRLAKPDSIETHSTGIKGVVIYHSNREGGRSVGFQAIWMGDNREQTKAFSIQKYGFIGAYRLAINERCRQIGVRERGYDCSLDTTKAEERLQQMGLGEYVNMQPITPETLRKRKSEGVRVNNNTGIDGVMLSIKKEKGITYLLFRSRCQIDGKEHSVSCSVKNLGFLKAAKEAVLWRMRRTGRAEYFSENLLCKKRITEWIMRSDEVRDAALKLNDEWLNNVLCETK